VFTVLLDCLLHKRRSEQTQDSCLLSRSRFWIVTFLHYYAIRSVVMMTGRVNGYEQAHLNGDDSLQCVVARLDFQTASGCFAILTGAVENEGSDPKVM